MLRRAQQRVRAFGPTNVETLAVMDAKTRLRRRVLRCGGGAICHHRGAGSRSTLDDFIRVLKPGGELILVNHIGAESGPRASSNSPSRRWRAGSAGGRNSPGNG